MIDTIDAIWHAIGARRLPHSGRSLADHLHGTMKRLVERNCDLDTITAGALHSIYGTNAFKHQTVREDGRFIIQGLVGARAESLVWVFSRCNRPTDIEAGKFSDRITKEPFYVDDADIEALRLIEAANLLDQNVALGRWPKIAGAWGSHVVN